MWMELTRSVIAFLYQRDFLAPVAIYMYPFFPAHQCCLWFVFLLSFIETLSDNFLQTVQTLQRFSWILNLSEVKDRAAWSRGITGSHSGYCLIKCFSSARKILDSPLPDPNCTVQELSDPLLLHESLSLKSASVASQHYGFIIMTQSLDKPVHLHPRPDYTWHDSSAILLWSWGNS